MLRLVFCLVLLCSPAMAGERLDRDLSYGPDPKQAIDVYWNDTRTNAPILVMLHGGAWRVGDKGSRRVVDNKWAHWGAKGFVFVSVNTRLLPGTRPDGQIEDLARALAYVQKNAAKWGGDPSRVVLMGHSAGAHVAAFVGADQQVRDRFGARPVKGTVVLDISVLDLEPAMASGPPRLIRQAFGDDPAYWRKVSPKAALDRGAAPFLVVCSSQRRGVCRNARDFAQGAKAKGVATTILPVGKSHLAINTDLGAPSAYTDAVSRWIDSRVR